jgi:hypothetical protein
MEKEWFHLKHLEIKLHLMCIRHVPHFVNKTAASTKLCASVMVVLK